MKEQRGQVAQSSDHHTLTRMHCIQHKRDNYSTTQPPIWPLRRVTVVSRCFLLQRCGDFNTSIGVAITITIMPVAIITIIVVCIIVIARALLKCVCKVRESHARNGCCESFLRTDTRSRWHPQARRQRVNQPKATINEKRNTAPPACTSSYLGERLQRASDEMQRIAIRRGNTTAVMQGTQRVRYEQRGARRKREEGTTRRNPHTFEM